MYLPLFTRNFLKRKILVNLKDSSWQSILSPAYLQLMDHLTARYSVNRGYKNTANCLNTWSISAFLRLRPSVCSSAVYFSLAALQPFSRAVWQCFLEPPGQYFSLAVLELLISWFCSCSLAPSNPNRFVMVGSCGKKLPLAWYSLLPPAHFLCLLFCKSNHSVQRSR